MEQHCRPRRSQSHEALRSNYAHHGRPLHKPLSRVNENSSLLASTGALEGMLKTTTETGDIGLFSIKSLPGTTLGVPSRGRYLVKNRYPHPPHPPHRSVDEIHRYDDGKKLPAASRDTTSEIISMYGSNSQGSVTSTLATSMDEPGQRSYSLTTVGSRKLLHHKSNITLQSQASSGPLQRPRSPFPYPTRLKRPGARPVSPAVTESGIVDYSRMVEIDRISLVRGSASSFINVDILTYSHQRTGHGPLKPSSSEAYRRLPRLRLRSDTKLSTPSLHGSAPPPICRFPGPPYPRTASAASIASWTAGNPPLRNRVNSSSSGTSSLTSVVNMYYRMPPALKAAQFGSQIYPPRYYDYTEEFENKQSRLAPPIEPIAPVPTRAPSVKRALVLREGSEEQLVDAFGNDEDLTSSDMESREDSQAATEPHLLSDIEIDDVRDGQELDPTQAQPAWKASLNKENNTPASVRRTLGPRRLTHGSDIDLLPSQICRASVDTFRPSLDIESKNIPLFSYPKLRQSTSQQTNTPSPARPVQVHGKTPTVKSEEGVILRGDEISTDENLIDGNSFASNIAKKPTEFITNPTKWCSKTISTHDLLNMSSALPTDLKTLRRQVTRTDPFNSDTFESSSESNLQLPTHVSDERMSKKTLDNMDNNTRPQGSQTFMGNARLKPSDTLRNQISSEISPLQQKSSSRDCSEKNNSFQPHRRHKGLEIRTKGSPQDGVTSGQLTPSCSVTPLIAPHPISPVRELKVKNSIPQLMKALPPLPGEPGYAPPSPPTTQGDHDDFVEILKPLPSLDHLTVSMKPNKSRILLGKPVADIQKKLPKIRIKSKLPPLPSNSSNRDSRPWNSDSNYPWCNEAPDIELANVRDDDNNRRSLRQKLRLRGLRTAYSGSPVGTVRQYPEARNSEPILELIGEQPGDFFSISNGLSAAFRQVSRKFSHGSAGILKDRNPTLDTGTGLSTCGRSSRKSPILTLKYDEARIAKNNSLGREMTVNQRRRLKKHISNLKLLLAWESPTRESNGSTEKSGFVPGKREAALGSAFGFGNIDFQNKDFALDEGLLVDTEPQPRFRRRVKAKMSKWMRGTKSALRYSRKERHAIEVI